MNPAKSPAARIVPTVHTKIFLLTIIHPRSTYFFFFRSQGSAASFAASHPTAAIAPPCHSPTAALSPMALRSLRSTTIPKDVIGVVGRRTFAAGGGKAKKGSKGCGAVDAPKTSTLSRELKSTTVVGGNILKDGLDPTILPDSEYPDWLWNLLDKLPST
ncbi:TMV resistance protein N-like [Forsythia ovata]|uniref:Large ribosomal subunit protein mL54 n=1 Tax=Forsythia ovata TaxID=205694 RepID=A0ABD1UVI9_9LAMI